MPLQWQDVPFYGGQLTCETNPMALCIMPDDGRGFGEYGLFGSGPITYSTGKRTRLPGLLRWS